MRRMTRQDWFNVVITVLVLGLIASMFGVSVNMGRLEKTVNDAAVAAEVQRLNLASSATASADAALTQAAIPTDTLMPPPTATFTLTSTPNNTPTLLPTFTPTATFIPTLVVEAAGKTIITGGTRKVVPGEFVVIELQDGSILLKEEPDFINNGYDNKTSNIVSVTIKDEGKFKFWQLPADVESVSLTAQGELSYCTDCPLNTFAGYVLSTDLPMEGMVRDVVELIKAGNLFVGTNQRIDGGVFLITE